ncbi:Re/Si-specific NAD(P)(+) transhydrogenase subunit alpha [Propionicimonas sp.]|uniref:Re/Si-specific NAD(P)(+) transhydrogenase subunit alpha n=1 Tax=Propionicimonas sp. TaxID=1955623 RepID=UPI00179F2B81|nr:Re/Si-specific NAD(P)(+) transhydrogenase subunit alpha [Propionicimonas sp.]MBU3976187.1 Re/Si-specific NAD(P)(+) transhydrogenase subunit alpha [Actinomycetota bacterium]MBA3020999.1 Re/Si-specific NAD(P)(+) transhydrogenase subunit alpha [Propionicimonas sp.]MBU3985582.1 Re/Si-specific NAD(P)(+) transhydrogenase subunit alpha [Actinomycetota bacterium]MBU4008367.1 Re/Si-specific NAD(P)(+) transhydrogenase subunit alpha [Actinomycetota bacterium]MBU4066483.1 Re/Si-specific NAD(P)(+) trans
MQIGIPLETLKGETRVAATPKTVAQLIKLGHSVIVEAGAGAKSSYPDAEFEAAGAVIGDRAQSWAAPVVAKINPPNAREINQLAKGTTLISLIAPGRSPELVEKLTKRGLTVMAMDAVPRISRAQALDVLSSMANIAGYRAVIEAANEFGSFFTGQVTAAGKVPPAKVFVSGAGVAGLAAVGTAKSLGAIVRATDLRAEVAEQVQSMGGEFVAVQAEQQKSSDGYAKEASDAYKEAAAQLYADQCKDVDIIITTALIPGKPAPRLITAEMVATMKPGSVIVDMAASNGGNVEGSVADKMVVTENGVKIIGYTDLPGRLPTQASQLYGTNVVNLFKLLTPNKDGEVNLDFDDVVIRGMTVCKDGDLMWPPPPVQVSAAAPAAAVAVVPVEEPAVKAAREAAEAKAKGRRQLLTSVIAAILVILAVTFSPASFVGAFTVFALAVIVGFYVISGVAHSLHTPLMAQTNAISGIILVGAVLQLGSTDLAVLIMSFIAAAIASINIFGGFLVSYRMLSMFKKGA